MRVIKFGDEIRIEDGYLHRESIKEIPGRWYDAEEKVWYAPCTKAAVALLQILGADLSAELRAFADPERDVTADEEVPVCKMPIKIKPYKHQVRAFNFAMQILCGRICKAATDKGGDAN